MSKRRPWSGTKPSLSTNSPSMYVRTSRPGRRIPAHVARPRILRARSGPADRPRPGTTSTPCAALSGRLERGPSGERRGRIFLVERGEPLPHPSWSDRAPPLGRQEPCAHRSQQELRVTDSAVRARPKRTYWCHRRAARRRERRATYPRPCRRRYPFARTGIAETVDVGQYALVIALAFLAWMRES